MRKTKIICTMGPAADEVITSTDDLINQAIERAYRADMVMQMM